MFHDVASILEKHLKCKFDSSKSALSLTDSNNNIKLMVEELIDNPQSVRLIAPVCDFVNNLELANHINCHLIGLNADDSLPDNIKVSVNLEQRSYYLVCTINQISKPQDVLGLCNILLFTASQLQKSISSVALDFYRQRDENNSELESLKV